MAGTVGIGDDGRMLPSPLGWPSLCAVCGTFGPGRVCRACLARFAPARPRCARCALPLDGAAEGAVCGACLAHPPPFDAAVAGVDYRAPWDRLLADFKFHDAPELAGPLAAVLLDALRRRSDLAPGLVLPVPLARARLAERGHNQAWELARRIARALEVPAEPSAVVRVRETPHQLALPPDARAGNVRGAFAVDPSRAERLAGRRVLLVDDVMTTGSTAGEVARALRAAGAAWVAVAVVARVPRPGDR